MVAVAQWSAGSDRLGSVLEGVMAMAAMQDADGMDSGAGDLVEIETRFGRYTFDRQKTITLPQGLLGFAGFREYGLASFHEERFADFRLFQALGEPALSFIVLPLAVENPLIAVADVADAAGHLAAKVEDLALLLIVTVRRADDKVRVTVNTAAPVFVDTARRLAWQHVLHDQRYSVQHDIAG